MTVFQSRRLYVRQLTEKDFDFFFLLNSDPEIVRYIRPPQDRLEAWRFFQENRDYYDAFPQFGRWATIEKTGNEFVGLFMLRPSGVVTGKVELGYALLRPYWGRGYATELVEAGVQYAFDKLGLPELVAITHPENGPSQNVLAKSRFNAAGDIQEGGKAVQIFTILKPIHDRDGSTAGHSA
jgi:ribosomal-protein-alanine N-acetyltransferase